MKKFDAIRALTDANYRTALTTEQASKLADPAGISDLDESFFSSVSGGNWTASPITGTACNYCIH